LSKPALTNTQRHGTKLLWTQLLTLPGGFGCPASAWLIQTLALRLFYKRIGKAAYDVGCAFWLFGFIVTLAIVSWSGMQPYGFDPHDRWQVAGWYVFFLSPLGLPLLFGVPALLFVQGLWFWYAAVSKRFRRDG
jgi:hypothetical protein